MVQGDHKLTVRVFTVNFCMRTFKRFLNESLNQDFILCTILESCIFLKIFISYRQIRTYRYVGILIWLSVIYLQSHIDIFFKNLDANEFERETNFTKYLELIPETIITSYSYLLFNECVYYNMGAYQCVQCCMIHIRYLFRHWIFIIFFNA